MNTPHDPERLRRRARPSFTCPFCQMTSHNPTDITEGYCGNCYDWTGDARPFLTAVDEWRRRAPRADPRWAGKP